ncbi:MAG: hypothetical protein M1832_001012 [Thelocarpon impressellum]|nr:MAG: hypothetical protein M1832_001012 [Thelocarpon impressellum]
MAAVQLSFNLRTSGNAKTVHLLGSWDNYNGQLPLAKDSGKKGAWKGTFRFQGTTLQQGQRYWYYYIIDGYHVSHDPAHESTTEPTTGRTLNILDVPADKSSKAGKRRTATELPHKGRPLSVSQIKHPKPEKPYATQHLYAANYEHPTVDELTARFGDSNLTDEEYLSSSPPSSVGSSLSSRSGSSSPSSASSLSDYSTPDTPVCKCERFGITRKGDRVKLDCGGARCGLSDSEGSCSSDSEGDYVPRSTRRQGVVIRR